MGKNKTAQWVDISEEVQDALNTDKAVVALESTIISHGMPYPQNLETALAVEKIIRNEGAFPATIAISGGKIKIGLSTQELQKFAQNSDLEKVSRRDLPVVLSQKLSGGTTVAATIICAKIAGIPVFVTGGIGGVHRENEKTMDVSADLMALAYSNVAVVCAGIKSILDIPRTLEYLETHGVPVIGYQTSELPSFYTPSSGSMVQTRFETPSDIARCMKIKWDLGLDGGLVIGNPVPQEESMDESLIEEAIVEALKEATEKKIEGKEVTPYLLERINQLTNGESLKSNMALIRNNASLGAKIALAYKALL